MKSTIARLLRVAAFVICLTVIASFGLFAVSETKSASQKQTTQIAAQTGEGTSSAGQSARDKSTLHRTIDEAAGELTAPFSSMVSSSSEWLTRGVKLALALAVYGFGLGYLARAVRVST